MHEANTMVDKTEFDAKEARVKALEEALFKTIEEINSLEAQKEALIKSIEDITKASPEQKPKPQTVEQKQRATNSNSTSTSAKREKEKMVRIPCSVHPNEEATKYCLECDTHQNACKLCKKVNGRHRTHKLATFEVGLQRQVAYAESLLAATEDRKLAAYEAFRKQADFNAQVNRALRQPLQALDKTVDKLIGDLQAVKVDVHTAVLRAAQTAQSQSRRGTDYVKLMQAVHSATNWVREARHSLKDASLSHLPDLVDHAPSLRAQSIKLQRAMQVATVDLHTTVNTAVDSRVSDELRVLTERVGNLLHLVALKPPNKSSKPPQQQREILILASGLNNRLTFAYDGDTWAEVASLSSEIKAAAATCFNGKMVVAGGSNSDGVLNAVEQFDPDSNSWTALPHMLQSRSGMALACYGKALFAIGGQDGPNKILNSVERYNLDTKQWQFVDSLKTARKNHCCAVLTIGMLAAGGTDGCNALKTCELFNRDRTATWKSVASLEHERSHASAATFNDKVYVFGGSKMRTTDLVEEYDSIADKWTLLTVNLSVKNGRFDTAAASANNRIYLCQSDYLDTVFVNSCDARVMKVSRVTQLPKSLLGPVAVCIPVSEDVWKQLFQQHLNN